MSFSYDPESLDVELNRLRLEIGDTQSRSYLLHDEEIAQVQSEYSSFYSRASKCCHLIASIYARKMKYKAGNYSEDPQELYKRYIAMASHFSALASLSYPWSGAIYESDKEETELDDSIVSPKFRLGIHDN